MTTLTKRSFLQNDIQIFTRETMGRYLTTVFIKGEAWGIIEYKTLEAAIDKHASVVKRVGG